MRLLQSVRPTCRQTKKPPQQFVAHRLRRLLRLPGPATFRHLSRSSADHERTVARWYARDLALVSLQQAAITQVRPPEQAPVLVSDASVVPQRGQKTSGLDRCWNGSHRHPENGLELSTLAWLDMTANGADCLRVAQPPHRKDHASEATRMDIDRAPLAPVVSEHHLSQLRDVVTAGDSSPQQFTRGVRDLGLEPMGQRRIDAHRRALYPGSKGAGPGRPQTYDGTVHGDDRARVAHVETDDDAIGLDQQVLNHVPDQCHLRVVLVVDTTHHRRAVLVSTAVNVAALTLSRDDQARVQIELLCRDAPQLTGLADAQAKRNVHGHARLRAVTRAKLGARQHTGDAASVLSMASLKRRACNPPLRERMAPH